MTQRHWSVLALLVLALYFAPVQAADDTEKMTETSAVDTLKKANFDTDTKALIANIKKRTVSEELRTKIAENIRNLASEDFEERETASKNLVDIGAPARPQLRVALNNTDLETRKRARRALDKIGSPASEASTLPALAFVLATRKAENACELILNFLPSIEEVETAQDVAKALALVAKDKNGKPEPVLLKALSDKYAVKRWAAGSALAQAAHKDTRDAVLKLLDDADTGVVRRVATTLTMQAHDKGGVPALIKLLNSDSADDASEAAEILSLIGKEQSPEVESGDDAKAKTRHREAWAAYWKKNGEKTDLSKVDFTGVGRNYTLIGLYIYNGRQRTGKMLEVDKDGKVKWEIDNLTYPSFAVKTRRDRVLICEYNNNKVSERDTKGKVIWQKTTTVNSRPVCAERLPNGNTLIVGQNSIIEVDRDGKDVKTLLTRQNTYDIVAAGRHRDGTYSVVLQNGSVLRLDSNGKQTKSYNTGGYISYMIGLKCQFLPKGGVVIPDYSRSKIREFDGDGKSVADISVSYPFSATKLPNGNYGYRSNTMVYEVTKQGKRVSETNASSFGGNANSKNVLFADRQ